jgi:hypothetical protein
MISVYVAFNDPDSGIVTVICLIVLLVASEILSASSYWNKRLSTMLNLAIMPMVITFFLIVIYKVIEIIGSFSTYNKI